MIALPERSAERDAALPALLARVAGQGWTFAALRGALSDAGADPLDAELLFPGGAADMIEAYADLADRWMEQAAVAQDFAALRPPARVRALIALRLQQNRPYREAVRRAVALLALPRHAVLAGRCTARTVDAIWHAAGDRAADFSWYTKRAILAGVYGATLLFWLHDAGEDDAATLAFLDRRLKGVARLVQVRRRAEAALQRLRPGLRRAA
jgi:ubiquinone biosynthesis protein COQ9